MDGGCQPCAARRAAVRPQRVASWRADGAGRQPERVRGSRAAGSVDARPGGGARSPCHGGGRRGARRSGAGHPCALRLLGGLRAGSSADVPRAAGQEAVAGAADAPQDARHAGAGPGGRRRARPHGGPGRLGAGGGRIRLPRRVHAPGRRRDERPVLAGGRAFGRAAQALGHDAGPPAGQLHNRAHAEGGHGEGRRRVGGRPGARPLPPWRPERRRSGLPPRSRLAACPPWQARLAPCGRRRC